MKWIIPTLTVFIFQYASYAQAETARQYPFMELKDLMVLLEEDSKKTEVDLSPYFISGIKYSHSKTKGYSFWQVTYTKRNPESDIPRVSYSANERGGHAFKTKP